MWKFLIACFVDKLRYRFLYVCGSGFSVNAEHFQRGFTFVELRVQIYPLTGFACCRVERFALSRRTIIGELVKR